MPRWLDDHEEREQDLLAHDPPGCGVHHDRDETEPGNGVHDHFMRVKIWVPLRSYGLVPVGREVSDAPVVEIEDNRFE